MVPSLPQVKCKICDVGVLQRIRKYRMSAIVVVIGYILLIPSVLGVLISAVGFFAVPAAMRPLPGIFNAAPAQDIGAAGVIAGGIFIFFGLASLVGGLLGWLLVMKKDVLQCGHCGAVVAAS